MEQGAVAVWDVKSQSCVTQFEGHAGAEELRVFNSKSWSPVWSCKEEVGGYHSLVFGDSAQYLFAGCGNRSVVKFCNWFVCW